MRKWRTIPAALREVKKQDPDGAVSAYMLRKMVKEGKISHLMNGHQILIDMDEIWGKEEQ